MSENTQILSLPLIQANQAQKHITHNEAIRRLDALVQPVVADMDRTDPPATPNVGDRHIVAVAGAGEWAGQDHLIAVREDNAWVFIVPSRGWRVHVAALGVDVVFDGSVWAAQAMDSVPQLGVNTGADATNRLSVSSAATLLSHEGGDHQLKINKAGQTDTNSLLFQTGWSGRAEMGCTGDDAFAIKVSADGAAWSTALSIDPATGNVDFPAGLRTRRHLDISGRWSLFSDNRWVGFNNSFGAASESHTGNAGTGAEPNNSWQRLGLFVPGAADLVGLRGLVRCSSADVTAVDLRIVLQTGPLDGSWTGNAATNQTVIHAADGISAGAQWSSLDVAFTPITAPQDGHILVFVRPVGTLSSTEFMYATMQLDYIV